jgi:hypothetical protein
VAAESDQIYFLVFALQRPTLASRAFAGPTSAKDGMSIPGLTSPAAPAKVFAPVRPTPPQPKFSGCGHVHPARRHQTMTFYRTSGSCGLLRVALDLLPGCWNLKAGVAGDIRRRPRFVERLRLQPR